MSTVNALSSSSLPSSSSTHITSSSIDIFYHPPRESLICEMVPVNTYSASPTIKTLVKILKEERGPVAVIGELALAYLSKPKFNHKVDNIEIYGWAPGSPRHSGKESLSYAFVLGARIDRQELIYFAHATAKEYESCSSTLVIPSLFKRDVYVVSHETFKRHVQQLLLPKRQRDDGKTRDFLTSTSEAMSALSDDEHRYLDLLRYLH